MYLARDEAFRLRHDYIGSEHLLLGLMREGEGLAMSILVGLGLDLVAAKRAVEDMVPRGTRGVSLGEIPFTPRAKHILELSVDEAKALHYNYVGTEHLLLGLIRAGEGIAARVLIENGIHARLARKELQRVLGGSEPTADD